MDLNSAQLEHALELLGELLMEEGSYYEVVAIGGGSLLLLNQIERSTKDLDLVARVVSNQLVSAHPLPEDLTQAIHKVGNALELGKKWLNPGPAALLDLGLPEGFNSRLHTRHYGGLTVHYAGRLDQICFKLYAAVDQGPLSKHFTDLQFLRPTESELSTAKAWCVTHDVSAEFAASLEEALSALGVPHALA
jgi:hypothetical protein